MKIARSVSTVKNMAERMTAVKNSLTVGMDGEERIVYLGGKPDSAWWKCRLSYPELAGEGDHYYREPRVSRRC
jgi:hypothetical protein